MGRGPAGNLCLVTAGIAGIPRASLKSSQSPSVEGVGDGGGEAVLLWGADGSSENSS